MKSMPLPTIVNIKSREMAIRCALFFIDFRIDFDYTIKVDKYELLREIDGILYVPFICYV